MKQAARLYSKKPKDSNSPGFNSSVARQNFIIEQKYKEQPGPGQYQVSLPLVKPKYEAIFKNNRSIIIKVNDIPVPAFDSRAPRFKQRNTISYESISELEKNVQQRDNTIFSCRKQNRQRYNYSFARKKSISLISSRITQTELDQKAHKDLKSTLWSKYRGERKNWDKGSCIPGPGSYNYSQPKAKPIVDINSWQFRSSTKRAFYGNIIKNTQTDIPEDQQFKNHSIHSRYYKNY